MTSAVVLNLYGQPVCFIDGRPLDTIRMDMAKLAGQAADNLYARECDRLRISGAEMSEGSPLLALAAGESKGTA